MGLETGTYVSDLTTTNPPGTDKRHQGDDHLRLIKTVVKNTLPTGTRALYLDGIEVEVAAAAGTTDVLGAASDHVLVSGAEIITGFGTGASRHKFVRFSGACVLTHHATSFIMPGGANITTAAGDTCIAISDASNNVRIHAYQRATGLAVGTELSLDLSPVLGAALDGAGFDLNNLGVIFLTEQAAAEADVAGKGQIWVKTVTPNELWFTDDAGNDHQLLADVDVGVTVGPVPTSSTFPIGACVMLEYTSTTAVANGSTAAGTNLRTVVGSSSGGFYFFGTGAVQTGTWKNVSGVTQDANGTNAFGYWVRTA